MNYLTASLDGKTIFKAFDFDRLMDMIYSYVRDNKSICIIDFDIQEIQKA